MILNRLYALLMAYPEEKWGWDSLSRNPNITLSMILENLHLPWDFKVLRERNDFCAEFARKYFMSEAPNFAKQNFKIDRKKYRKCEQYYESWENLKKNVESSSGNSKGKYKAKNLSYNTNITLKNAQEFPTLDWDSRLIFKHTIRSGNIYAAAQELYDWALSHSNMLIYFYFIPIDIKFIRKNVHTFDSCMWFCLSQNRTLTWEMIESHKDIPWNYLELCHDGHKPIPLHRLEEFKEKIPWIFMSDVKTLTLEFVKNNPQLDWNWGSLIYQPWMTTKMIHQNIEKIHVSHYFSCEKIHKALMLAKCSPYKNYQCTRPDITVEFCEKHENKTFGNLSYNLALPFEYVRGLWGVLDYDLWQRQDVKCYHVDKTKMTKDSKAFAWLSQNTFFVEKRAASTIRRNWLIYRRRKVLSSINKEISLLPPSYIHKEFVGGEEYRKSCNDFYSRI